eukprot:2325726-Pleurochrysis_carterae.AAC.1
MGCSSTRTTISQGEGKGISSSKSQIITLGITGLGLGSRLKVSYTPGLGEIGDRLSIGQGQCQIWIYSKCGIVVRAWNDSSSVYSDLL